MGKMFSGFMWTVGAGAVAIVAFAYYRNSVTGRDMMTVIENLPEELREAGEEWKQRLQAAVSEGKMAAARREAEIEAELAGVENEAALAPDYVV